MIAKKTIQKDATWTLPHNPPNSACTEGVLTVLGKRVLWFLRQPVHATPSLIFAAISHTSCRWPSPLCSEMVGRTTFYRKTQYKINLFGLRWSLVPQWRVSACLGWYSDHIWVIFWLNMSKSCISSKWACLKFWIMFASFFSSLISLFSIFSLSILVSFLTSEILLSTWKYFL